MDNAPSPESKEQTDTPPEPEVLAPRSEEGQPDGGAAPDPAPAKPAKHRRNAYRPSHKGTFIGLSVVVAVLAVNAGIIGFVLHRQAKQQDANQGQVTISQGVLDRLGVNRNSVGNSGIELTVGPDARFNGKVTISGDTSIAGQLKLSSKLAAADADFAKLQAGKTSLSELNVNGDSTVSKLNVRNDLAVGGNTKLQGTVTVSRVLMVGNALNVAGNAGIGGILSVGAVSTGALSSSSITVSGHVTTRGSVPSVSRGPCIGSNGTVSISGNDAAGTVAVNAGAGACSGILANITFRSAYGTTPHVVITPVGAGMNYFYVNRSATGFSIGGSPSSSGGGYAFDYIVEQ